MARNRQHNHVAKVESSPKSESPKSEPQAAVQAAEPTKSAAPIEPKAEPPKVELAAKVEAPKVESAAAKVETPKAVVLTRSAFLERARTIEVRVDGSSNFASPRRFASGSVGYGVYGKMICPAGASARIEVDGHSLVASRRDFSTGSSGWWAQGKVEMEVDGLGVLRFQVGITMVELPTGQAQTSVNITLVKSKDLPD